jgi:hypothetical protein
VTFLNSLRIVFWIAVSVSGSTELVASSNTRTFRSLMRALHNATSCLSPPLYGIAMSGLTHPGTRNTHEKLLPSSDTSASSLNFLSRS